ncbi:MAG: glycosyltransferase family 39 protein [Patescibacteria group bacterium]|nr:glycosyltransferase family 39 protein [Patescibacteria group bacterium]
MINKIINNKKISRVSLVLSLFLISAFLLHFWYGLSSDEGIALNGAWNIYNGRMLYHDFFEYISPGSFYLIYGIFSLFGASYLIVKIFSFLCLVLSTWLIYKIFLILSPYKTAGLIATFVFFIITSLSYPLINHNTYSLFLTIILTYFLFKYLSEKKVLYIFLSGILSALTFYFLQNKGIALIIWLGIFLVYLYKKNKISLKHIIYSLSGILLIFAIGLMTWGIFVFTALLRIVRIYHDVNKISYTFILLFIIIWLGLLILYKKNDRLKDKYCWLFGLQLALFISILNLPDIYHLLLNSFPLIILSALLIREKYNVFRKYFSKKLLSVFVILIIFIIYASLFLKFTERLETSNYTKNMIKDIKNTVKKESIFAHPFLPGLYFELKKYNPYYTNVIETIQGNQFFLDKNYNILINEKPSYIITNYKIGERFNYQKNIIDQYIENNYKIIKKYNNTWLWQIDK